MSKLLIFIFTFYCINTTCLANLQITEIFPNPTGKDSGQEWIEIYNPGPNTNLQNWQISTQRGDKTIKKNLPQLQINTNQYLQIKPLPFTIKNNDNTISLFSPQNHKTSSVKYKYSPENKSYSLSTQSQNNTLIQKWSWGTPSPNSETTIKTAANLPVSPLLLNIQDNSTKKQNKQKDKLFILACLFSLLLSTKLSPKA